MAGEEGDLDWSTKGLMSEGGESDPIYMSFLLSKNGASALFVLLRGCTAGCLSVLISHNIGAAEPRPHESFPSRANRQQLRVVGERRGFQFE